MSKNPLRALLKWEWLLVGLIIVTYLIFHGAMPDNYTIPKLLNQTRVYMVDVGFMALGMMLILVLGDIDISVASIASLSCTIMGVSYAGGNGVTFPIALMLAVLVGAVCGFINGMIVTRFKELFPMIITLATSTLFRGTAYIILKDQSSGSFPSWYTTSLGYGMLNVAGLEIPIMLICLLVVIPIFFVWIHKTASGRRIFATGTNIVTSRYSGLTTDRIKVSMFVLNGIMAAIGGIFLTARTGSVKYTMATGYEMQAIAAAVLGGASTAGGKGSVIGLLLALVLLTCLKNGLMLMYNDSFVLNLAIGVLLIAIVLLPNMSRMLQSYRQVQKRRADVVKVS
ncbi:ABC transporter permease [Eubacteriales bacterium OttesenSCG-928-N13]|nr:ABC transporter permease [Eubacteriales bacterium OttesenSCG-928-N13]